MAKIIWSSSALNDIDLIAEFISRDSVDRASLFIDRIIEMTNELENFSELGRTIPEINNKYCREIIHGARDWKPE